MEADGEFCDSDPCDSDDLDGSDGHKPKPVKSTKPAVKASKKPTR